MTQGSFVHKTQHQFRKLTGHIETLDEGISDLIGSAVAERTVGQDVAFGIDAAHTWTWVDAFFIDARTIHGTFRTNDTLGRSAVGRRSLISRQTRTTSFSIYIKASGVWTAWRRLARIVCQCWSCARSITRRGLIHKNKRDRRILYTYKYLVWVHSI